MAISLPAVALPAWSAYCAMSATKLRHFRYLQHLEEKYRKYGSPTTEEARTLNTLLQAHDTQVKAFKNALQALKMTDLGAYTALLNALREDSSAQPIVN